MKLNYRGGVLLTTLLFVFLFTFIFHLILDDFQLTRKFDEKTKQFYQAKIMVYLTIEAVKSQTLSLEKGKQLFAEGEVTYQKKEDKFIFTVNTENRIYSFEEKIVLEENDK